MGKKYQPGRPCCTRCPCPAPIPIRFAGLAGCCPAYPFDVELFDGDDSLGTWTITDPGLGTGPSFTLPTTVLPGTVISWTATKSPYPEKSGTFTLACDGYSTDVVFWSQADLPDGITLTDPLGNAIGLTRRGAGLHIWDGTFTYTLSHPYAPDILVKVDYTWNDGPCVLRMHSDFNTDMDFTLYPGAGLLGVNYCVDSVSSDDTWVPPTGATECDPLLMEYLPWWNITGNHPGHAGPPVTKSSVCACGSPFFNGITANFLLQGYLLFPCEGAFTVTL